MPERPRGTVTFLFTDIEGSTERWERDRPAMAAAVDRHLAVIGAAVAHHGGVVFKTVGDAVQAAFPTAPDAVTAALDAQRALLSEDWGEVGPVRVRMALHVGEATPDAQGDYLAAPLNRLSRLVSIGNGGQILLSQTVQQLTRGAMPSGGQLRDLGEHRLRDLLEPERVFQLMHPQLPAEFPPLRSLDTRPHNLPLQPTPFLGREGEVLEVVALLQRDEVRLLTLTGPGGIGKTRLAVQVAAELIDAFADGVFFVSLALLSDPALVPLTIAETLGLREEAGRSLVDRLRDFLAPTRMLLVLDNVEHVIETAPIIGELLGLSPALKVLATSRAPLRLRAEREHPVPPLGLPRRTPPPSLEQLTRYEAVRLFIDRAHAVNPDFAVDDETAPAVAEICHRLDGLPLAIELAAARVRMLPPRALLAKLEQRLPVLTIGAIDAPARQRTLRDTIAWSYDLLAPSEQALFWRLSGFPGGCTLEAAEAVCADELGEGVHDTSIEGPRRSNHCDAPTVILPSSVFDLIDSLCRQSLLQPMATERGEVRFAMLQTLREYGMEQLAAAGETDELRRRQGEYFIALATRYHPFDTGSIDDRHWLDLLEAEDDNLWSVLAWSLQRGEVELGLRLANALFMYWYQRKRRLTEARSWLKSALVRGQAARIDDGALAYGLLWASALAHLQDDVAHAQTLAEEALAIFARLGERQAVALARYVLAIPVFMQGECNRAEQLYRQALEQFRADGHAFWTVEALLGIAQVAIVHGDHEQATAVYDEALHLSEHAGSTAQAAMAWSGLGFLARARGDPAAAHQQFQESLAVWNEIDDPASIAVCLEAIASTICSLGEPQRAARLLGAAEALREQINYPIPRGAQETYRQTIAGVQARLSMLQFATAWVEGQMLSPAEAVALAHDDLPLATAADSTRPDLV